MAKLRTIRARIRGVKSIAKITKAMEMIAASKMRKAQERGLAGRPYSEMISRVIAALASAAGKEESHALLERRQVKKIAIIHITPDRGLAGGMVGNINRKTAAFILEKHLPTSTIVVGRKGLDFMRRLRRDIVAEFSSLGDKPSLLETLPIARVVMDDFIKGSFDEVYLAYTRFLNTAVQRPVVERLIPVEPTTLSSGAGGGYIFEPDASGVLNQLLPRYVEMQIYHAILESIASEQSARMVAMRNATENANELIGELTLIYNKARQESITSELLDIVGGAAALS